MGAGLHICIYIFNEFWSANPEAALSLRPPRALAEPQLATAHIDLDHVAGHKLAAQDFFRQRVFHRLLAGMYLHGYD